MNVSVQEISGNWDIGYALDKHTVSSIFIGYDEYNHALFNTTRTELGEALYRLKYRFDRNQINPLAQQIVSFVANYFKNASFIVPMPPSKSRSFQPVFEIAKQVSVLMNIPYIDTMLVKSVSSTQIKNIALKADRVKALCSIFKLNDQLAEGKYDVLIIDDLYDTGSSLEAATATLRKCIKINKVFVITITRINP